MIGRDEQVDAIVIGAGYYGCRIALHLQERGYGRILLVDKARRVMTRSSFVNQARVHGGYHYPRAIDTAYASRRYFEAFLEDHGNAICWKNRSIYAIANGSRVSPRQFERVCAAIGAPLESAPRSVMREFETSLIDAAYLAEEYAFDAVKISEDLCARIQRAELPVLFGEEAKILEHDGANVIVQIADRRYAARQVYNCTYSELEYAGAPITSRLRHELAEIALIAPPRELADYSVTVMDGPFFSTLPFPALGAHSLTHVRFTPVLSWSSGEVPPAGLRTGYGACASGAAMIADSARYLPVLGKAQLLGSLFDIKTVMAVRENDDGRPILFEEAPGLPNVVSVLGSKIDNVYDVLELLDRRVEEQRQYA